MPVQQTEWSAEAAIAIPADGKRYEVLDGVLVVTPVPSWDHETVVEELGRLIGDYAREHDLGAQQHGRSEIVFGPRRLVQPDILVVPRSVPPIRDWKDVKALLLAIEVLSRSTARTDRIRKRHIYQSEGVPEYWIVDVDARIVERWRPADVRPEVALHTIEWQPREDLPPLVVDLATLFREVGEPRDD